jgi:hydrogenase-4 component F
MTSEIVYAIAGTVWFVVGFCGARIESQAPRRMTLLFLVLWACLGIFCAAVWRTTDLGWQWVFVEASTLVGALLISMNRFRKTLDTAWKFLLVNSYGLGIAFLGLILLSYGQGLAQPKNATSELGLWLMMFGYSAKLGLFPNHFWVKDAYSNSPGHVAAGLAALLPPVACFPLYHLIALDNAFDHGYFTSTKFLILLASLTIVFSIFALVQATSVGKVAAYTAMFHNGVLGVFLGCHPTYEMFLYMIASVILVKSALFLSLTEIEKGGSDLEIHVLLSDGAASRPAVWAFAMSLIAAFTLPVSPLFVSDLLFLKNGFQNATPAVILVPLAGTIFFGIAFSRIYCLIGPNEESKEGFSLTLSWSWLLLAGSIFLGACGLWLWPIGEFFHA